jgi:hypothetical protein
MHFSASLCEDPASMHACCGACMGLMFSCGCAVFGSIISGFFYGFWNLFAGGYLSAIFFDPSVQA